MATKLHLYILSVLKTDKLSLEFSRSYQEKTKLQGLFSSSFLNLVTKTGFSLVIISIQSLYIT
jgi:hypothetical protein